MGETLIKAEIVSDSVGLNGSAPRLTTFVLTYPRFIHAELMTHRSFSRNASSSRAIPIKKLVENIRAEPATPIHWGVNKPGMQADKELTGEALELVKKEWLAACESALKHAETMEKLGAHKQNCNRILEPFMHMVTLVTATEWDNFYALRNHPDAQPEIQALAKTMLEAHNASNPQVLNPGEWHAPFIRPEERQSLEGDLLQKVSSARCARVSYLKHDGQSPNVKEDLKLFERLMGDQVKHASPTEHVAQVPFVWQHFAEDLQSNLRSWIQYRKTISGETVRRYPGLIIKEGL